MSSSAIDLTSWTKDRHNNVHRLLQVTINFAPPYYYNFFDPTESPSVEFNLSDRRHLFRRQRCAKRVAPADGARRVAVLVQPLVNTLTVE